MIEHVGVTGGVSEGVLKMGGVLVLVGEAVEVSGE